jgi:aspartate aminotransferase-like enzyme
MIKRYLLAPGPTPIPPEVLQSMAMPIIHHRSADFAPVLESARNDLKWLFQTENDVLILSSSGTGGMVAAVNNFFSAGDRVLVVNGGKFGERWTEICQSYGLEVKEITVEWGHAVDPADVEAELEGNSGIKGVFVQASETSTGVYHDIEALARVVREHGDVLFVVDAISGLVAHDLRVDDWGVDVMVAGSQKGLMMPPGLAFVSVGERAWQRAKGSTAPRFYFDLEKERKNLEKNQTNFTTSVTLVIALSEALKILKKEGLDNVFRRHALLAGATRAGAKALGLGLFARESPSNAVTAIEAPEGVDAQEIYTALRDRYGITGAGGQDRARGRIFRLAHLGFADTFDVITALAGLEMVLKGLGQKVTLGAGVAAAEEILMVK